MVDQEIQPPHGDMLDEAPVLADRVRARLLLMQSPEHRVLIHTRRLKAGLFKNHPVEILAHQRLQKAREEYLHPDQLAHSLTLCAASLPSACLQNLQQIVLLPELVHNDRHLLTHLYFPAEQMLAFYLYPRRLNEPGAGKQLHLDRGQGQEHRLVEYLPARVSQAGLLEQVLRTLGEIGPTADVQKFLLPFDELKDGEMHSLQICANRYSLLAGS